MTNGSSLVNFFLNSYRTPPFLLPIFLAAAQAYQVPWQVLAAINEVESNYGLDLGPSSAGAEGWMQFLPEEWLAYGVDANGAGVRDPYNAADAIFAAARYLAAAGASTDLRGAIYAYNHSSSYVESVILRSQLIAATPQSLISSLTAIVSGRFPVEGSGPHTATAVWSNSLEPTTADSAAAAHSSSTGAPAPPPALAATAGASLPGPTVAGASVAASPGGPVVAVQNAEVIRIGRSGTLGRFIELRDAYGDVYTYGKLGRVLNLFAEPQPMSANGVARDTAGAPTPRAALAPLRKGTWVAAGTVLGNVPGDAPGAPAAQAHFLFEIRPAGAGPIDPRPLLQSWQLLEETQGRPQPGAQPLFGPEAGNALIDEIQLLSERQLRTSLSTDTQLRLSSCERKAIAAGLIDRRVLTTLDFLLSSGIEPTVSGLECAGAAAISAGVSGHTRGAVVAITALDGVPIRGHEGRDSLAEIAARRLLTLPVAIRPQRIAGPLSLQVTAGALFRRGSSQRIEIGFNPPAPTHLAATAARQTPPAGGSQPTPPTSPAATAAAATSKAPQLDLELGTAQWRKLITRISQLPEPHLQSAPAGAVVADTPSSPLPTAGPAGSITPVAPSPRAPAAQPGVEGTHPLQPEPAGSGLASPAPPLKLAAPLSDPLISGPGVILTTTANNGVLSGDVNLEASTTGLSSITSYSFQYEETECDASECWKQVEAPGTSPTTTFVTEGLKGLFNLRVIVTAGAVNYESELTDQLIANEGAPVVTLTAVPRTNVRGEITLSARIAPSAETISSLTFQWAHSNSPAGVARWHTITELPPRGSGVTTSLNTKEGLPDDGDYDFRVVPENEETHPPQSFASIPVRKVLVDNTPPTVALTSPGPGSKLKGQITLSATAEDPSEQGDSEPGSGVASVRFQARSLSGHGAWINLGGNVTVPSAPNTYTHTLNSESLQNGPYEFRVLAEDEAGNETTSQVVSNAEVENRSLTPSISASIAGIAAPAEHISFLGVTAASPQHEAEVWAYGFTKAPPADVEGTQLPYTAEGEQLVLLRYTKTGGWQIADVPREPGGKAFKLLPAGEVSSETGGSPTEDQVHVTGAMTPSGEAWLSVAEASTNANTKPLVGLFHRVPGAEDGHFVYDSEDTHKLEQLLGSGAREPGLQEVALRLGEGERNGRMQVYGMLNAAKQSAPFGELKYGLLQEGKWTLESVKAAAPPKLVSSGAPVRLAVDDVQGPGEGWGAFEVDGQNSGLILGHLENGEWTFLPTGLDALDLTGALTDPQDKVEPKALKAEGNDVWIEADVLLPGKEPSGVVARFERSSGGSPGRIINSWCTLPAGVPNECKEPLGAAAVPDAIFHTGTESEPTALALKNESVDVFAHGDWTRVAAAPGYEGSAEQTGADDTFSGPSEGWLGGANALGHWSGEAGSSPLASWPLPDRSPLTAVALPPGDQGGVGESGALAVGLNGTTLSYDASAGWLEQSAPPRAHHINLLGVAFAGPSSAFAVGQFGAILHWDGTAWSEDPQSLSLTASQLNAVAFAPSGEGWAVGANGTILHYNGSSWNIEAPPSEASGVDITSVAVAGANVYAVAGGNLITRSADGGWTPVSASSLPSPEPKRGNLRLVAGLPDGGVVAAGKSVVLVREAEGQGFNYAAQPLEGIAVALAPFREADGKLRAYVSIAPPAAEQAGHDVAGFPPGDGELMRQTDSGWQDLSRAQYAGGAIEGDGGVKSDPVLAVTTNPTGGEHAWAVGGYDGTEDAAGRGTQENVSSRPVGWQSASIWRYDATGSAQPPELTATTPSLPAKPGTVSFAFFTSPMCRTECADALDAQPVVNLTSAAREIDAYAAAPGGGGPSFAMLGGNAVGPVEGTAWEKGNGEADFAHLPEELATLGSLPTFAALGRFDYVPTQKDETRPWAEAFSSAPAPFGSGPEAPGITPVGYGGATGEVHSYYAFDASQNGGTLRVIVLNNSRGSLEASSPGQESWLKAQLESNADAAAPLPVVVITALPLRGAGTSDGEAVASLLASSGVLAVFTTDGARPGATNAQEVHELDERHLIPEGAGPGAPQIPEYEGASLGYQEPENNGVVWYFASIDTQAREVHVSAVPVIDSLSLKAVDGLSVARSLTLQFEAVGRRPAGTLATKASEGGAFAGYDDYVEIPAPSCGTRPCVPPSYAFTSSEPTIGEFVEPSGPGSPLPKLNASKHPIPSSTSGLFCAYNSGSTTITVTAGLLSYSQVVTVQPGGFGSPCGTVFRAGQSPVVHVKSAQTQRANKGAAAPPAPPPAALSGVNPSIAFVPPPPALQAPSVPAAAPKPAPTPPAEPVPTPVQEQPAPEELPVSPAIVPPATPPVEPIPPGGAAQAPSAAEKKEKARKHASQSAYTIRPAGTSAQEWFFPAVAITGLLAMLLSAAALPLAPRRRPALVFDRRSEGGRRRNGR